MRRAFPIGRPAVFVRSTRLNQSLLSVLFILAMGACGNFGGCGACGSVEPTAGRQAADRSDGRRWRADPRHAGGLQQADVDPARRAEPAARRRVLRPAGRASAAARRLPRHRREYCTGNNGPGARPAARSNVALNQPRFRRVTSAQHAERRHLDDGVDATIPIDGQVLGIGVVVHARRVVEQPERRPRHRVRHQARPTASSTSTSRSINSFQLNLELHRAAARSSDIANLASDDHRLVRRPVRHPAAHAASSTTSIQGFLPNPLGIAGMMDIGKLLEGVSPGTEGFMEARIVPGGYVDLVEQRHEPRRHHRPQRRRGSDDAHARPRQRAAPVRAADRRRPNFGAPPANLPQCTRRAARSRSRAAGEFTGDAGSGAPTSRWASRRRRSISPVTTS